MVRRKRWIALTVFISCFLCSVTAFAAARDSKGWNVYNSSGTVYANVGVTYVSDTFEHKTVVGYTARVLGQDASAVTKTKPARLEIEGQYSGKVDKYFWDGPPMTGTEKFSDNNTFVTAYVTIDDTKRAGTRVDLD